MTARTAWPNHAGLISWSRARSTGTHVGVYRSAEAGLDTDPDNPWSTVCEPHAGFCSHPTRALALQFAPHPEDWCPTCQQKRGCADCGTTDPRHDPDCPNHTTP